MPSMKVKFDRNRRVQIKTIQRFWKR